MAPFKSSLAKSLGKLLGVSKQQDLSLRGGVQSSRQTPRFEVTGGTTIISGDYTYHVFTADTPSPESSLVVDAVSITKSAQILVVGGGGEGAKDDGGGGGAGSVVYDPSFTLAGQVTYAVTVGASVGNPGGPGTNPWGNWGAVGNPSSFGSNFLAKGGGAGTKSASITPDYFGGSGGGGAYPSISGTNAVAPGNIPPNATSYQNNGAPGRPDPVAGGGGGGANDAGQVGGRGGNGQPFPVFPGPVISPAIPSPHQSAFQTAVGPTGLFGGGGGSGHRDGSQSPGGTGGGGNGGYPGTSGGKGTPGIYGTGGGGGGTGGGGSFVDGDGASGIVIVRYTTAPS